MESYQRLEKEFGEWIGVENVVATSSGTAALHLAFEAMQLPPLSEVVLGDYNMIACPRAVAMAGLKPVFVDCDDRLLIDALPARKRAGVSDNPPVILATHIYGRRCDMDTLIVARDLHDAMAVEDLAEAHWVKPHPDTDAACWSFYKNKLIAGEEGGAVAFKDPQHAELARKLRCLGFDDGHDYNHIPRGHNYRLANCLADKILKSLHRVGEECGRRNWLITCYEEECPVEWRMPSRQSPWIFDVRVRGMTREKMTEVIKALNSENIAARHGFLPMSWQREFNPHHPEIKLNGSNWKAAKAAQEVFYLPLGQEVKEADCERAFQIIKSLVPAAVR